MGKSDTYKIDLKGMGNSRAEYHYSLSNQFFADIDAPDVHEGQLETTVSVHKLGQEGFEIDYVTKGFVVITCDRCLGKMNQPIEAEGHVKVKFGQAYSDEDDELIVISERESGIDLAWLIYESIVLAIPIKHVHKTGECDEAMMECLRQHQAVPEDDNADAQDEENAGDQPDDNHPIDPRWEKLKSLTSNN